MRPVAYMAKVEKIEDIVGKDNIKYVKLVDNGFKIIHNVKTMPIHEGGYVVYIEYDTIIKPCQTLEFLRSKCWSEKHQAFKLKAMKMAGVVSYGLIISVDDAMDINKEQRLDSNTNKKLDLSNPEEFLGKDLSEYLCIKPIDNEEEHNTKPIVSKFEAFLHRYLPFIWSKFYAREKTFVNFPAFAANHTDEVRIENVQYVFETCKGLVADITLKIDGSSFTASLFRGKFYIASRNMGKYSRKIDIARKELVPQNTKLAATDKFIAAACKYRLAECMFKYSKLIGKDFTIQGELAGEGIQGNKLGLKGQSLFLFNMYYPDTQEYLYYVDVARFGKINAIPCVPYVWVHDFDFKTTEELKEIANKLEYGSFFATHSEGVNNPAEGIVVRLRRPDKKVYEKPLDKMHGCLSFKVISDTFVKKYL